MQQPLRQSLSKSGTGPVRIALPVLQLFAGTLFLSAFLLFSIQPYFSKLVLPKLGGSPGVWSVAMVFFQSVLLLGYGYAHLLTRFLRTKHAVLCHGAVLLTACLFLPLGIANGWDRPPADNQEIWLLGLFGVSVGLPFFAVAANAPLLQAWFSRTGHRHSADPYFLYGASNIGSFASLYLYILVFEPSLTLGSQSLLWSAGYVVLVAAIILCAGTVLQRPSAIPMQAEGADTRQFETRLHRISAKQIAVFLCLSAVPSALTIAVTSHVTVDVASAPFMWVIPLSLFLLTFVLSFRDKPFMHVGTLAALLPWAVLVGAGAIFLSAVLLFAAVLFGTMLSFFIAVLYCHSRLYQLRPHASQLTAFYLWMSFGGVIGGIFAGLVAPNLFDWVIEYPMLLLVVLFLVPQKPGTTRTSAIANIVAGTIAAAVLWFATQWGILPALESAAVCAILIVGVVALAAIVQLKWQAVSFQLLILTVPLAVLYQSNQRVVHMERSFFGVIKVADTRDKSHRTMVHGTTVHGSIASGAFEAEVGQGTPEPLAYYHVSGEMADTLRAARDNSGGTLSHAGIVGLGTGSFLCHRQDGESWTVYEIDKAVIDVASNPSYFRFVSDCGSGMEMVLGDARLTLNDAADDMFDYLLIDAFSSDAIPVHLMTREAIALYLAKLAPHGILALHISNRHLELASVLAAIAEQDGYAIRFAESGRDENVARPDQVYGSDVVALARHEIHLAPLLSDPRWKEIRSNGVHPWTDDYSNVVGSIMRHEFGE